MKRWNSKELRFYRKACPVQRFLQCNSLQFYCEHCYQFFLNNLDNMSFLLYKMQHYILTLYVFNQWLRLISKCKTRINRGFPFPSIKMKVRFLNFTFTNFIIINQKSLIQNMPSKQCAIFLSALSLKKKHQNTVCFPRFELIYIHTPLFNWKLKLDLYFIA